MACASCGGGRQLTPNKPQVKQNYQSPHSIRVTPNAGGSSGAQQQMTPNASKQTKRTQV